MQQPGPGGLSTHLALGPRATGMTITHLEVVMSHRAHAHALLRVASRNPRVSGTHLAPLARILPAPLRALFAVRRSTVIASVMTSGSHASCEACVAKSCVVLL